ncbi:class I SAM-dependent DNA methyltransferase [Clostridium paridis]|uniref:Class I SAM-dependent methyltransferase n=1 Tax=Clostridium paridis TaxID=2803863 RepID=A0A937FGN3_9CLOT|nr:class I SAM-dependent methyltransferase [Clostridium paridis]MBL4931086.1 class I SAM-dependent methyltransferase [Clostridium paridis]
MSQYKNLSNIYDNLIYEDIDYEKISDFIMNVAKSHNINNDKYLDLATGTGNVAKYICKNFRENFLVDLSEEMLMEAGEKVRKNKSNAKVVLQDMRYLELNRKFNLITCVLDSTNYILSTEDLRLYFNGVYNHLEDNGIFIFDINSSYKIKEVLGNNIFNYNTDEIFYSWENYIEDNVVEMELTFFVKEGTNYRRFEEYHRERAYEEKEIEDIISSIGFEILGKHDDYTETSVMPESERIVYILKK